MPSVRYNRLARDKTMAQQQFDAIWDPAQNRDMTVHLKMDVHEDLTDILEELCSLQRLGDFSSARKYFEEQLGDQVDDPYVLAQYGEMLLEQGDYLGILSQYRSGGQYQLKRLETERNGMRFLIEYWDLIVFFSECHCIPRHVKGLILNQETLRLIDEIVTEDQRDITSTELKYLALLYHLCGLRHPEVTKRGLSGILSSSFPSFFHKKLYRSLLRQGRIWDLRDMIVARMATGSPWTISAAWSTDGDFRVRLHDLVAQWTSSSADNDASTLLALLDIITSLVCWDEYSDITPDILVVATQIARLIIDHHPEAMKTRPFINWVLLQCESAELGSHDQLQRQEDQLDTSPGILYRRNRRNLAQYAPYKTETPDWTCREGPPELQNSARMALRTSINMGDYRTQAKTLQLLILMSANPIKEFEELGKLQNLSQGDNYNFTETLAAKYLVSRDELLREKLRIELAGQWSIPGFSTSFSAHQLWIISKIRYALARDAMEAERALSEADAWYEESPWDFIEYVARKMPTARGVSQGKTEARPGRHGSTKLRSKRRNISFSISPEPHDHSNVGGHEARVIKGLMREASDHRGEGIWEGGNRSKTRIDTRNNWRSRTRTRTIIDTRVPGFVPIFIADTRPSRPSPTFRKSEREPVRFTSERNITYTRESSLDETDYCRGRSHYRDVDMDVPHSQKQWGILEKGKPGNQLPRPIPIRTTKAASQNIQKDLRPSATTGNQSTHKHPQAAQPTIYQESANEHTLVPVKGNWNYKRYDTEDEDKDTTHHEESSTQKRHGKSTSFNASYKTNLDKIESLPQAVTVESVEDVGEDAKEVGSLISFGSD
ncbi:hypothetical protein F5Y12DRAFT_768314 [Xylaria sp. FL1777]|nr:hypothetical protein F5Y12DRAFT_768314 [Xylaria sp. FL1777]